jgi:LuxR family maltose regulon positive regulatory protein
VQTNEMPDRTGVRPRPRLPLADTAVLLSQGETATVVHWAEAERPCPIDPPVSSREPGQMAYARLLLAQSRLRDAEVVLAELENSAREGEPCGRSVNIRVLQVLTQDALGHACQAVACLEEALRPAVSDGYCSAFLDPGRSVLELPSDAHGAAPDFLEELLGSFEKGPQVPSAEQGQEHVEPLTTREMEVLRLLADGLSNREIAARLVVTPGTAKWHVQNVRGKLHARNRTHAVARGRRIGLLP